MDRPNIVIIQCDQMRAFDVGCYGHPLVSTPNIDRLASEGVRFQTAVANTPVCSPSRAALLAGQHARSCVGSIINAGLGAPQPQRRCFPCPTLPEALQAAGYDTALIGKWHIDDHPNHCGFDQSLHPLPPHQNYGQRYFRNEDTEGFIVDQFGPTFELDEARQYLQRCAADPARPFFLHYNPGPPHMPVGPGHAPEKYLNLYDPAEVPLRPNALDERGQPYFNETWFKIYTLTDYWIRHFAGEPDLPQDKMPEGMTLRELTAWYLGLVTLIDDLVGGICEELTSLGLDDNTLVVFVSDHGDNLGSHGRFNKGRLIEESIRVPLVIRGPGCVASQVNQGQVAQTIDLMPTLLKLAGVDVPEAVQGRDLGPLLRRETDRLEPDWAVIESPNQGVGIRTPEVVFGVPHETGKAGKRTLADEPHLLYDLRDDPYEMNNRIDDPAMADLRHDLWRKVRSWDQQTPLVPSATGRGMIEPPRLPQTRQL